MEQHTYKARDSIPGWKEGQRLTSGDGGSLAGGRRAEGAAVEHAVATSVLDLVHRSSVAAKLQRCTNQSAYAMARVCGQLAGSRGGIWRGAHRRQGGRAWVL